MINSANEHKQPEILYKYIASIKNHAILLCRIKLEKQSCYYIVQDFYTSKPYWLQINKNDNAILSKRQLNKLGKYLERNDSNLGIT